MEPTMLTALVFALIAAGSLGILYLIAWVWVRYFQDKYRELPENRRRRIRTWRR